VNSDEPLQDRLRQQHMYLKELDDQIRQKKELLERERRLEHEMPSPPVALDAMSRQRKQFPGETAKMFTSAVFPPSPHRSSFNPYMTLPPIHNASQEDLSMQSLFPPTAPDRTTFVRGAMNVAELPQWKQDELLQKEDQKKRQQKEIQDVLKQQIAEKEQLKQKQKLEQRMEDEKEQKRILQEQQELYERYAREKEEQRKKEEQEALEKQAKLAKQKQEREEEQKYQQSLSKSAKAKRAQRPPSPEDPPMQVVAPQPFRSTSPPLPAVMKKMKEQGLELPSPTAEPPVSKQLPSVSPQQPEPLIQRNTRTPFQEVRLPRTPISTQPPVQTITPKLPLDQQDTIKILEQLEQIQKVPLLDVGIATREYANPIGFEAIGADSSRNSRSCRV
jgi:myosin heavy subunit